MGVKIRKIRGKWYLVIDYHGRRKTKAISTSKAVAIEVKRKVEARLALGDLSIFGEDQGKAPTIADYADRWLHTHVEIRKKPLTFDAYERMMRLYVLPQFGTRSLRDGSVTPAAVEDFIYSLATRKDAEGRPAFTQSTVNLVISVLRAFFTYARRNKLITSNPAAGLGDLPKSGKPGRTAEAMTRKESEAFLEAIQLTAPQMYGFFLLALRAGLRRGELAGLQWGDIAFGASPDDPERYILVQRTWSHSHMGTPKSGKSRRVDLSRQAREVLLQLRDERWLAAMQAGRNSISDDLVFPGEDGQPLMAESIAPQFMEPALAQAGLRKFTIHALRHTFASLLIQGGAPLKYVQEQMGHSSIKITADQYGHLERGANVYLIDKLDAQPETGPATNANQAQTLKNDERIKTPDDVEGIEVVRELASRGDIRSPYAIPNSSL